MFTGWERPSHWLVLAVVVAVLFGYKKLPDAARSVGRSLRIFKTEIKGMGEDDKAREAAKASEAAPTPPTPPAIEPVPPAPSAPTDGSPVPGTTEKPTSSAQ
jgi:sec-independent protein translocase protein TatA